MSKADQNKRNYAKTRDAPMFMERWDAEDVAVVMDPDRPVDRILSRRLGRSVQSIQVKRSKENKRRKRAVIKDQPVHAV